MSATGRQPHKHGRYVLDSSALAAYISGDQGFNEVSEMLDAARAKRTAVYLTMFGLSELLSEQERAGGASAAESAWARIQSLPLKFTDVDRTLAIAAAHIKACYHLQGADPFAAALAERQHAALVTSNVEYRKLEKLLTIKWLPKRLGRRTLSKRKASTSASRTRSSAPSPRQSSSSSSAFDGTGQAAD